MGYVKRKATTSKGKYTLADFEQVKKQFLKEVTETVLMEEIPPELALYWRNKYCTCLALDYGSARKKELK